ncbi:MAG: AEC family transporter [Flavobacteriales bacterium]|nr:AEC family transporter [Flavobacteriales bacterium]
MSFTMSDIINIILPFFALVVTGYVAARLTIIESSGILGLNRFVYFFALPALLFSKMALTPVEQVLGEETFALAYLASGLLVFAIGWVMAKVLFRMSADKLSVMALSGCYANIGFMGIPVLVTILGAKAAAPLSIMLMIDVAFFIPFATTLIDLLRAERRQGEARNGQVLSAVVTSVVKNPLIIAIVLGFTFSATGIGLPGAIGGFTNLLGQAAAPAAMFALGAVLAGRPMSEGMGEVAYMSVVKLAVHPLVMWWGMTLFGVGAEWRLAVTLGAATPVAASMFVIAQEYKALPVRVSTAVLLTTAVSMITLPLLIAWLN